MCCGLFICIGTANMSTTLLRGLNTENPQDCALPWAFLLKKRFIICNHKLLRFLKLIINQFVK